MKIMLSNGTILDGSEGEILAMVGAEGLAAIRAQSRAAALQPATAAPAAPAQTLPATTTLPDPATSLVAAVVGAVVAAQQAGRDQHKDGDRCSSSRSRGIRLSDPDRVKPGTALVDVAGGGTATFEDAHNELSGWSSVGIPGAVLAAIGVSLAKSLFFDGKE